MVGATGVGWTFRAGFFGEEKKLRMPPLDAGGAGVGGRGAGLLALNWATMCGSRRTFKVSVNSSLLCSMLPDHVRRLLWMIGDNQLGLQFKFLLNLTILLQVAFGRRHKMNSIIEGAIHYGGLSGER
jgi:hypothetical protein